MTRRELAIDEQSYEADHPKVAIRLWMLAVLLRDTDRLSEALPLMERSVTIDRQFARQNGVPHPDLEDVLWYYRGMLRAAGVAEAEIESRCAE